MLSYLIVLLFVITVFIVVVVLAPINPVPLQPDLVLTQLQSSPDAD